MIRKEIACLQLIANLLQPNHSSSAPGKQAPAVKGVGGRETACMYGMTRDLIKRGWRNLFLQLPPAVGHFCRMCASRPPLALASPPEPID